MKVKISIFFDFIRSITLMVMSMKFLKYLTYPAYQS